ncbi:hypothetical protein AHAS_Ahas15G0350500 [Arachis hypogaea]
MFWCVLAFVTTYPKNKYNRSLVVFLRTNHHGQTCIFGCDLVSDEKRKTYLLVLKMFMEIMGNKQPIVMVTHRDLAMMLHTVFVYGIYTAMLVKL